MTERDWIERSPDPADQHSRGPGPARGGRARSETSSWQATRLLAERLDD